MKNEILLRIRTLAAVAVLAFLTVVPSLGQEKSLELDGPMGAGPFNEMELPGVWNARVNITVCATGATLFSFNSIGLFGADGSFHDTNSNNPILFSRAFGYWTRIGLYNYQFAMRAFRFDPAGNPLGSQIVRHTIDLSPTGQSYTSWGTAEMYDTAGNPAGRGCSTATATRFR